MMLMIIPTNDDGNDHDKDNETDDANNSKISLRVTVTNYYCCIILNQYLLFNVGAGRSESLAPPFRIIRKERESSLAYQLVVWFCLEIRSRARVVLDLVYS